MNNSDMPATPTAYMDMQEGSGELYCDNLGLTKLEELAGRAMHALLSSSVMGDSALHDSPAEWRKDIVEASIEVAEELLAELEKRKMSDNNHDAMAEQIKELKAALSKILKANREDCGGGFLTREEVDLSYKALKESEK